MKKGNSILLIAIACLTLFHIKGLAQDRDRKDLEEFIESNMNSNHIPGCSFSIVKGEEKIWISSYGNSNIERSSLMTDSTIINIASVSKTITTTAVMQLWEKGNIDLDADINNYLPFPIRNPNHGKTPITIRHLLTHTSSIQDAVSYWTSMQCGDPSISLSDWIYSYLNPNGGNYDGEQNFLKSKPGEEKQYSNVAFGLLAYIVESVANTPFHQYCNQNIFRPLKMNDTGWYLSEVDTSNHAKPYFYVTEENVEMLRNRGVRIGILPELKDPESSYFINTCLYSFPNYSDGSLRSSIRDLSKFAIAMLNEGKFEGKRILNSKSIEEMLSLQIQGNERQGLCWFYTGIESVWGHDGQDAGVQTGLFINPELKIGVVYLQNSMEGEVRPVIEKLYRIAKNTN